MKRVFGIAILAIMPALAVGQAARAPMAYELYSWKNPAGRWTFCLLPSPSGVSVTAEQVFSRQCRIGGLDDLKRRISELPEHATVFWLDHVWGKDEKAGKGEKLCYPPSNVVADVKHEAGSHGIELKMAPLITI